MTTLRFDVERCTWKENEEGAWNTDCGHAFEFVSETPEYNSFVFCPYCGGPLDQRSYDHDAEESE